MGRQQPVEVIFSLWQGLCCYCHWNFPATSFFWVRSKDGAYMMNRGNSLHLLQYLYKLPGSSWRTCWYQKIVRCLADLNHTWSFQAVSFSTFSTCYILQTLATSITFMDDSTLVQTKPWVTMSRRFDLAQVPWAGVEIIVVDSGPSLLLRLWCDTAEPSVQGFGGVELGVFVLGNMTILWKLEFPAVWASEAQTSLVLSKQLEKRFAARTPGTDQRNTTRRLWKIR